MFSNTLEGLSPLKYALVIFILPSPQRPGPKHSNISEKPPKVFSVHWVWLWIIGLWRVQSGKCIKDLKWKMASCCLSPFSLRINCLRPNLSQVASDFWVLIVCVPNWSIFFRKCWGWDTPPELIGSCRVQKHWATTKESTQSPQPQLGECGC